MRRQTLSPRSISSGSNLTLVDPGRKGRRRKAVLSMLCALGFEFEEKLRLASVEQANAQHRLQSISGSDQNSSKRFEVAVERYNGRLADYTNHRQVCTLCRATQ
jgi:hypothetical protein